MTGLLDRGRADLLARENGFREKLRNNGKVTTSHLTEVDEIVARPVRWAWQDRAALAKITGARREAQDRQRPPVHPPDRAGDARRASG